MIEKKNPGRLWLALGRAEDSGYQECGIVKPGFGASCRWPLLWGWGRKGDRPEKLKELAGQRTQARQEGHVQPLDRTSCSPTGPSRCGELLPGSFHTGLSHLAVSWQGPADAG